MPEPYTANDLLNAIAVASKDPEQSARTRSTV